MKNKIIYSSIIVIGVGAIAYMYFLTDKANDDKLSKLNSEN